MVTAAWDTSGLVALYKDGVQCTSCCFEGYEPGFCCPGFPENGTPSNYTVELIGVVDCGGSPAAVNGRWTLDLIECEPLPWGDDSGCIWLYKEAESEGNVWINLRRSRTLGCDEVAVNGFQWASGAWRIMFIKSSGYTQTTGWCDIVNNPLTCSGGRSGKLGTAQFWPLTWPQWVIATAYSSGNRALNNSEIYDCNVAHVSASINEPGVGADWASFWSVGDPCGDANVACP